MVFQSKGAKRIDPKITISMTTKPMGMCWYRKNVAVCGFFNSPLFPKLQAEHCFPDWFAAAQVSSVVFEPHKCNTSRCLVSKRDTQSLFISNMFVSLIPKRRRSCVKM